MSHRAHVGVCCLSLVLTACGGCVRAGFERVAVVVGDASDDAGSHEGPQADLAADQVAEHPTAGEVALGEQIQPSGCDISASHVGGKPGIAFCEVAAGVDQCNASKLCGGGWQLCTASEYRAFYPDTGSPPPVAQAWLASCVRSGVSPYAPSDVTCGVCSAISGPDVGVSFPCVSGPSISTESLHIGVGSALVCRRPGVDDPSNDGYWEIVDTTTALTRAACCKQ